MASLQAEPQGQPKNTGVGSLPLLQQIFPTQELHRGLLHCRWIPYQLSYQGSLILQAALCLVTQSCLTLCNPMHRSLPGSSVHGDSPGMNMGVGCQALLQGNLPNPGIKPRSPALQTVSLPSEPLYSKLLLLLSRFSRVRLCATP